MTEPINPDVVEKRERLKAKLAWYQQQAIALYGSEHVTLTPYGPVQACEGGAYVEMTVWVPNTEDTPK